MVLLNIFFILTPIWGSDPVWLIFSRLVETTNYCWWKKSQTTTWDGQNPIDNGTIIILNGAGFLPSTVVYHHHGFVFYVDSTAPFCLTSNQQGLQSRAELFSVTTWKAHTESAKVLTKRAMNLWNHVNLLMVWFLFSFSCMMVWYLFSFSCLIVWYLNYCTMLIDLVKKKLHPSIQKKQRNMAVAKSNFSLQRVQHGPHRIVRIIGPQYLASMGFTGVISGYLYKNTSIKRCNTFGHTWINRVIKPSFKW